MQIHLLIALFHTRTQPPITFVCMQNHPLVTIIGRASRPHVTWIVIRPHLCPLAGPHLPPRHCIFFGMQLHPPIGIVRTRTHSLVAIVRTRARLPVIFGDTLPHPLVIFVGRPSPPRLGIVGGQFRLQKGWPTFSHILLYLHNILVTDDLNIVLCNFAFAVSKPKLSQEFSTAPPPMFEAPFGFYGHLPTYVDVYGFGVILFALLANCFPWTPDLVPSADVQLAANTKHSPCAPGPEFNTLVPELHAHFGSILVKCFHPKYVLRSELLNNIKHARNAGFR
ncbi:hypothetical protein B0H14DRAFT_3440455 [Mycena olivaceomarginata]|nr:hypothetical protein B0H14DRAFT_3440455 [Mycena olivaceomarginata]